MKMRLPTGFYNPPAVFLGNTTRISFVSGSDCLEQGCDQSDPIQGTAFISDLNRLFDSVILSHENSGGINYFTIVLWDPLWLNDITIPIHLWDRVQRYPVKLTAKVIFGKGDLSPDAWIGIAAGIVLGAFFFAAFCIGLVVRARRGGKTSLLPCPKISQQDVRDEEETAGETSWTPPNVKKKKEKPQQPHIPERPVTRLYQPTPPPYPKHMVVLVAIAVDDEEVDEEEERIRQL
jgi:hypothetical protein